MKLYIHNLLLRFKFYRKHYMEVILEQMGDDIRCCSTAAKVGMLEELCRMGYIVSPEEYMYFLGKV